MTSIWYAAGNGRRETAPKEEMAQSLLDRLRFLLDVRLEARGSGDEWEPPIAQAAGAGDPARVRLLLERGALPLPNQPAETCYRIRIPLFCAAVSGSASCVRLLLEAGAGIDDVDSSGFPALAYAGSAEAARALLDAGARFDMQDKWDNDVLTEILAQAEIEADWGEDPDPFGAARVLLEAGASLELPDEDGWTRLHHAAFRKQPHVVDFLLNQGAPIRGNRWGATPLHMVCWQGEKHGASAEENVAFEPIIRRFVAAGNSVDARDADGQTPLHEAAYGDWENTFAIRTLLALGAEVDPVDKKGQTPLHLAARHGGLDAIRVLLAAGADPDRADADGWAPTHMAMYHEEIWQNIVRADEPLPGQATETADIAEKRRQLHDSAIRKATESVELLVRAGTQEPE